VTRTGLSLCWWLPEYPPDPGGIATFAGHLVPGLASAGHHVTALIARGGPEVSEPADRIVLRREPLRETLQEADLLRTIQLKSTTRRMKQEVAADLYHIHLCEPSPFLHLATLDAAPAPTVLTVHNDGIGGFDPNDPEGVTTRLFAASRIVTCVSSSATRAFARTAPRFSHRLVPIPNGAPVPERTTPVPNEPRLVAIGRLAAQKGFDRLLQSMPAIIRSVPEVRLDILGDGPDRAALEQLIASLDLAGHVVLRGALPRHEVGAVLDRSRLVVAPSRFEGLPYAMLEAAGHGRPIVATDVAGIDEVVADGVTGLLVHNGSIDDEPGVLSDAVVRLLTDHSTCAEMGRAARERTISLFSLDASLEAYEHVYRAATQRRRDIAVVIPVHNGERHLAEAIESALLAIAHADVDGQVKVIDDGSTDASLEIARSYADRGVEVFSQPNLGTGLARNTGLALTDSEWVAHLDADDRWPVDRLRTLLAGASAAEDAGRSVDVVHGLAVEFADDDAPTHSKVQTSPVSVRLSGAAIVRRSVYDSVGGYSLSRMNDQMEWTTRAIDEGLAFVEIDNLVLERRIHAGNKSHDRPFTADSSRVTLVRAHLNRIRNA
jgi:glycosyltransferase involved in cell wall biosynthesis